MSAHIPPTATAAPPSWLRRYLQDPSAAVHTVLDHARDWLLRWGPLAGPAAAASVVVLVLGWRWWRRRCADRLTAGARLVVVSPPPTVDPDGAPALWANLVGLLRPAWRRALTGQPHLAFEYVFDHHGVRLQLWVPGGVPPGLVERAVQAAWPGAHTRSAPAAPPLRTPRGDDRPRLAVGGQLRLARPEALPIRTDFGADPIRALLAAPTGLQPGQAAAVQVLARPVTGRRVARARRAARHLHAGRPVWFTGRLLDLLTDLITPGRARHASSGARTSPTTAGDHVAALDRSAADRAIAAKLRGSTYETVIRYALTDAVHDDGERGSARDQLRGRAHAVASAFAGYAEHNYYRRRRLHHPVQALAGRRLGRGDLLGIAELAAVAHLPLDQAAPGVQRAGAQAVPPPPDIPTSGRRSMKPLGVTDAGHPRPVGLRVADARHHLHIIGATGSGKTELIAQLILADVDAGRGVVAVDPKGDMVADLLRRLPASAASRLVLFDATSRHRPPCLNPLDGPDTPRVVDNLTSIFSRVYAGYWGPRTDDILRAGLLTLRQQPGTPTLSDLPRLLTNPSFRNRILEHVHDEILTGFWDWYQQLSEATRAQHVAPLMNKLRGFLLRPFVRAAIAGGPSTVNMREVLDRGGICLVRIAKDALGADTARLVGSIVVARTWQATLTRARIPKSRRPDASLYLDEAHNFLNLPYPIEDMLAEARAYRLSIVLAHQYLRQLPPELDEGISTNARNKIFFTASPEDARRLARHTLPRLTEHDLANLGGFHAAARLVAHGQETPAFTLRTEKLPPPTPGRARALRAAAHHHAPAAAQPADGTPQPPQPGKGRPGSDPRRAA
jgi:hypothetical protein